MGCVSVNSRRELAAAEIELAVRDGRMKMDSIKAMSAGLIVAGWVAGATGAAAAAPKNAVQPGHSIHGRGFDEGPRQAARLMGGTGDVDFQVTTTSARAQAFVNQGVGQLHGFWYFEAERSFRQAAAIDPQCAMAYWGMARANLENLERARSFITKAVELSRGTTSREKKWIDIFSRFFDERSGNETARRIRLLAEMKNLARGFPDDLDAKAFVVFHAWDNNEHGIRIPDRNELERMLQEVLAEKPLHPALHYRIHLWDGIDNERALPSMNLCGKAAPSIAHMWHMPGHIYSKLLRYEDAAWHQEAASRVDHAQMARDRVLPDQIHLYTHNQEWLVRTLSYVGRVSEAVAMAKNLIEIPQHPRLNHYGVRESSARYGRNRLVEILIRFELWREIVALEDSPYLELTESVYRQFQRRKAVGLAHYHLDNVERGDRELSAVKRLLDEQLESRDRDYAKAEAEASQLGAKSAKASRAAVDRRYRQRLAVLEKTVNELSGYGALARGDRDDARKHFVKPINLPPEQLARALWSLGDRKAALEQAALAVERNPNQVLPLAVQVDLLWRAGEKERSIEAFNALRALSGALELNAPAFKRLEAVASELGLTGDWRTRRNESSKFGPGVDLAELGPLKWSPYDAPDWILPDASGASVDLRSFRGKPVVVIFYLGSGCAHCIEQLNAFAPMAEDYARAGIALIAIGTDTVGGLKKTAELASEAGGFPFPLLADPRLDVFKDYRAQDDFERMPLHGTFLIDGEGKIRWQDIGAEPFMETKFLLKETLRLLNLSKFQAQ